MKPHAEKLIKYSPYLDHYTQSEYSAIFENGQFFDASTRQPIELENGTPVRIIVANIYIPEKDAAQHTHIEEKLVYPEGELFFFHMQIHGQDIRFYVRNKEKIYAVKKGNKKPYFINTSCEVFDWKDSNRRSLPAFTPIEATSFNEAFTRVSEKYRVGIAAHTCNVYNTFYDKTDTKIGIIRDAAF